MTSFSPSGSNGVVRPFTVKLNSPTGLAEPTTTFLTISMSGCAGSAVFVIVHTGTTC